MILRPTEMNRRHMDGECPEKMSVSYICLIAVVAVLVGVALAFIG